MSTVIEFPRRGVAFRYASLLALGYSAQDRDEVINDRLEFAERMVNSGHLTSDNLRDMIDRKRDLLLRQLQEIDQI